MLPRSYARPSHWRSVHRHFSSAKFGQTSVFMQSGLKIRELPMVVQKVNDVLNVNNSIKIGPSSVSKSLNILTAQDKELMEEVNQIVNVAGLFKLLESLPTEKVTPSVAVHCLKRIIHINNNYARLNFDSKEPQSKGFVPFTSFAFINMLLDIVYRSEDSRVILDGLRVVAQDNDNFSDDVRERMYEKTLAFIGQGHFSLSQVCETVLILSNFHKHDKKRSLEMSDQLWAGILDKTTGEPMDAKSVVAVFKTLPCLTQSRDYVYKVISNKAGDLWNQFDSKDIMEILRVLSVMGSIQCSYCQRATLTVISNWVAVNIHQLREQELLALIVCFDKMEFFNSRFVQAMEKYMRARGVHIVEPDLVAVLCDYCDHQKIRSIPILEASAEFLVQKAKELNTPQINSIAKVFGNLNIHPPIGFKFWDILETLLEQRFAEFPPPDLIHLLLSFVQISKFPVHMASKIFKPDFFDRLESYHNEWLVKKTMAEMDILLASLRLETSFSLVTRGYLSKYNFFVNRRKDGVCINVLPHLGIIVGDVQRITFNELVPHMCRQGIYIADMLIYPSVKESLLSLTQLTTKKAQVVAVLVHMPEHMDRSQRHLLGRQAMRERQFRKLGYKVMSIEYAKVNKLLVMPRELLSYLQERYDLALQEK